MAEQEEPEEPPQQQDEENMSRRSRPISHLSENNERWKDVVQELERELSVNKVSKDDEDGQENEEDQPATGPPSDEKEALKEELQHEEDIDEKTPLQSEVKC